MEDARNLGWKLAAQLQGWGGAALLDAYDAERRPVFKSTIDDFIAKSIETDRDSLERFDPARDALAFEQAWQARTQGAVGEVHAFEPNYEGSPLVLGAAVAMGACSAKGSHRFDARAGHHLAPATLDSGLNVFEALGPGFTLLALGAQADAVQAFREAAAALHLPLEVVADSGQGEAARYQARLILIRPDQFVAWSTEEASLAAGDAHRVLKTASGN